MSIKNKIEIFQSSNGEIEFKGDIDNKTVRASLDQISKLFGRDKTGISRYIKNIFKGEELGRNQTVAKIATVHYYNRQRMHSSNNNLSPVEFEEKMMLQIETAA